MNFKFTILIILGGSSIVYGTFDQDLYESVLDAELCQEQLSYIMNTTLLLSFLDSGIRTPRGILKGNLLDMGNYYQCLDINDSTGTSVIQGKYCSINFPLQQDASPSLPEFSEFLWRNLLPDMSPITPEMVTLLKEYNNRKYAIESLSGATSHSRVAPENPLASTSISLSVCIPQSCTTREALETLLPLFGGLEFEDNYCRLPNDKPWATGDYVSAVVFGVIGLLTLISTAYDLRYAVFMKTAIKPNPLYTSFSFFTNTRRLVTVASSSNSIECLDGLRVIGIVWVVLGHVYANQLRTHLANPFDSLQWIDQFHSIFISASPISVDTFFFLSGVLVVYTTVGKFGRMKFLKNIHIFYLNRLLRMFPLLAAAVLLQASWLNHVADGPYWHLCAEQVQLCRDDWWKTLLYIQNYVYSGGRCIGQSWYLAVDMQAYLISPVVLFWVMGSRRSAWAALALGLAVSLGIATTLNTIRKTPSSGMNLDILTGGTSDVSYFEKYYMNTLTRISPFFVGMIFGYLLINKTKRKIKLNMALVVFLWILCSVTILGIIGITYPMQISSWDSLIIDVMINSFMRPLWAAALGWMVFACANGYGGPINWILSLRMWKVPARLSYGVYIFHHPLQILMASTIIVPIHFSDDAFLFTFFADMALAFFVAFIVGVLIDAPFSTLTKILLGGGPRKAKQPNSNGVGNVIAAVSDRHGQTQL